MHRHACAQSASLYERLCYPDYGVCMLHWIDCDEMQAIFYLDSGVSDACHGRGPVNTLFAMISRGTTARGIGELHT